VASAALGVNARELASGVQLPESHGQVENRREFLRRVLGECFRPPRFLVGCKSKHEVFRKPFTVPPNLPARRFVVGRPRQSSIGAVPFLFFGVFGGLGERLTKTARPPARVVFPKPHEIFVDKQSRRYSRSKLKVDNLAP
jgi:hypothetical protein